MSSKPGYRTFNFSFVVSADKEKEWDEAFESHGEWMRETHALITKPDPTYGMLGSLSDYYVSKAPEMPWAPPTPSSRSPSSGSAVCVCGRNSSKNSRESRISGKADAKRDPGCLSENSSEELLKPKFGLVVVQRIYSET